MLYLYHGSTSVCSAKVRIGLAETGLEWSGQILDLGKGEQNAKWYLQHNPKGVVPTLVNGDVTVVESSVILEYLAELQNGSDLMPTDPQGRARARMWLTECIDIHAAINTMTFATSKRREILARKTPVEIEASIARMANPANATKRRDILANAIESGHVLPAFFTLKLMFDRMQTALSQSNWLLGDHYSLADACLIAYLDRLDRLGLSEMWSERTPNVSVWLENSRQRQSYAEAILAFAGPLQADQTSEAARQNWQEVAPKWRAFTATTS